MPKVSVIIPIYGVDKYIERCAVSLFEQILDDIEYIFVDDCTPDRSMEILESIIEKYRLRLSAEKKTVRIERMPTNSGQAAVRRHGVQLATGDYVIHCDSDDWIDVDMYRTMYEKAKEEDADVVVCDYAETDGGTLYIAHQGCISTNCDVFLQHCMLQKVTPAVWNKLFRRSIYMQNDIFWPQYAMAEDLTTTSMLLWFCQKVSYIPKPFYNYYFNTQSISKKRGAEYNLKRFSESCNNIQSLAEFYEGKKVPLKIKSALIYTKLNERNRLLCLISHWKYYKMWLTTFPEINFKILFMPYISFRVKFRFFVTLLGLFPLYAKMKGLESY